MYGRPWGSPWGATGSVAESAAGAITLADVTEPLVDVAEMSDGTVWIACWSATRPLLQLADGWARERITTCNGMVLSSISGEVVETAAPAEAGVIRGAVALHPEGWALAMAVDEMQLWQYAGGAWQVVAAVAGLGETFPWGGGDDCSPSVVVAAGDAYVSAAGGWYRLQGSALCGPITSWTTTPAVIRELLEAQEAPALWLTDGPTLTGLPYGNMRRVAADRWRGRWCGLGPAGLVSWDGETAIRIGEGGARGVVVGAPRRLHIFGGAAAVTDDTWSCYGNGLIEAAGIGSRRVTGGHSTGAGTWLVQELLEMSPLPLRTYHVLRVDDMDRVTPAVYEARQSAASVPGLRVYEVRQAAGTDATRTVSVYEIRQAGGGDAAVASPAVYEARQAAGALAAIAVYETRQSARSAVDPEIRVYEARQAAGSDATATVAVYEVRQKGGGDAETASPEVYELRQTASQMLGVLRVLEVRQWAHTDGGPTGGELVRFVVHDGDDAATAALVDCGPGADVRVLMRGEPALGVGAADVDAWGTYQAVTEGCRAELETPGERVRVVVVKAAEAAVPEIKVQTRRESE